MPQKICSRCGTSNCRYEPCEDARDEKGKFELMYGMKYKHYWRMRDEQEKEKRGSRDG